MAETRKIAAILAADVVGFSRMASADEDRTLARLRLLRAELIDPTVASQNGRVFKRTGDGALVEFRSVVEAVHCAVAIQNAMIERRAPAVRALRTGHRVGRSCADPEAGLHQCDGRPDGGCGHLDLRDQGREWVSRIGEIARQLTVSGIRDFLSGFLVPDALAYQVDGLAKAGMPE